MAGYDRQKHDELIEHEAKLTAQIKDLRDELNDVSLSDKPFDGARKDDYGMKGDLYMRYRDERDELRNQIKTMDLMNPIKIKMNAETPFNRWEKRGFNGLAHDEKIMYEVEPDSDILMNMPHLSGLGCEGFSIKAATRSDDATGQDVTDDTTIPRVLDRMKDYGGLDRVAYGFMTENGNNINRPQADNTAKMGRIYENQNTAAQDNELANFTDITFYARTCTTDSIHLTNEFRADALIDAGSYVLSQCVRRMGRRWDAEFTVDGDGVGTRARSLKNSTTKGADLATADTITRQDFNALIYSINRAYRQRGESGEGGWKDSLGGMIGYLITDELEHSLVDMDDGDNRPLWVPSMRDGMPDRIGQYPYQVSTTITGNEESTTGTAIAWFGNFGYYGIRTVGAMNIYRFFDSRTAQNNAVEYLGFSRRDARAMGAQGGGAVGTTEAIKYLAAA